MIFEIHITGDEFMWPVAQDFGHKMIALRLLDGALNSLGIDFMTSIVKEFDSFEECLEWTLAIAQSYRDNKCKVNRVKIECQFLINKDLINKSVYGECHWSGNPDPQYSISQNITKESYLLTDRVYDKDSYLSFFLEHSAKHRELELCLYDDNVDWDKDWLNET